MKTSKVLNVKESKNKIVITGVTSKGKKKTFNFEIISKEQIEKERNKNYQYFKID